MEDDMLAKRFFFVSAGILCLALAYHLGAASARAQAPGNSAVGIAAFQGARVAIAANGDTYYLGAFGWAFSGNIFQGGPVTTQPSTMGQLKARYR
jgi:hypothetical protein